MKEILFATIGLTGLLRAEAQGIPPVDFAPPPMNHEFQTGWACAQQYGVSPAAAGCVALILTIDEIDKCFTDGIGGRGCFGDNNTAVKMVRDNIIAARRENVGPAQVIRAATGISVKDLQANGLLGGKKSEANRECRRLPKWGFPCKR